jgi:hypothetical protein
VAPVASTVGITYAPDGSGYWVTGADGGVFAFNATTNGHANYYGSVPGELSAAGLSAPSPIVGFAPTL